MARRQHVATAGAGVVVASAVTGVLLPVLTGDGQAGTVAWIDGATALAFGLAGALLARARPANPLGWLLLLVGVCEGLADAATSTALAVGPGPWQTGAAWVASWVWFPALGLLPTAVLALYPTGRAGSRARRALVAAALGGTVLVTLAFALVDDAVDDVVPGLANPVAVPRLGIAAVVAGAVLLLPAVLLTVVDAGRRLWRAASPEREQLAWLLTTVVVAVLISYTPWHTVRALGFVLVPVAIAVGVLRHRLLDLQVVVRRTLLFAGLTAAVVAVFVVVTAALSPVLDRGPLPTAVAAGLVAVGLTPARELLQRAVDRLVYGERRDPVRAVTSLGRDLAATAEVDQVLATVARALRAPSAALVGPDGAPVAVAGDPAPGEPLRAPLQVGGEAVGELVVAARTARDGWSAADRALLDVLAPQVAVVHRAAQLAAEVTASRDRALAATAEERLRLRHELHDGLGPALTGIALGLEAAEVALARDPDRAVALLARLREETQAAGREVRRLVEGLRPAALESSTLAEAVTRLCDGVAASSGLAVEVDVPEPLPPLRPDVDAAAYRIVSEALTNVLRHSGAARCAVRLTACPDALRLQVDDDGTGLPVQPTAGVGLASMRRRAAELGGTWQAGPRPGGGTRIEVALPLRAAVGVPA